MLCHIAPFPQSARLSLTFTIGAADAAQEAAQDIDCQMAGALAARDSVLKRAGWRWRMFEEKREAVMAIEAAVLPLMT
jgi:hypothetical protein